MATTRFLAIPALALAVAVVAVAMPQEKQTPPKEPAVSGLPQENKAPPKDPPSEAEIQKLVTQLGDPNFRVRDAAFKRLREIGLPALAALQDAAKSEDAEMQVRAKLIINELKAVYVNGLVFKTIGCPTQADATPAKHAAFLVQLEIMNLSDKQWKVKLEDKFLISAKAPTGEEVFKTAKGFRTRRGAWAKEAGPLKSNEKTFFFGSVSAATDGKVLRLAWEDPFGYQYGSTRPTGFPPGLYYFSFHYSNKDERIDDTGPWWTGSVETIPEPIWISIKR